MFKRDSHPTATEGRSRILVCDDDGLMLECTRALLAMQGHEVTTVRNGVEALATVTQGFELLLLDLNMPLMTGHEVLAALRKAKVDIAVLVVSGENSIDGAIECLRRGAQDYLRKPYQPEELFTRVDNVLRERRLLQQNRLIQQRLSDSERLHRFFVENSPDLIYLLDANGRFAYTNHRIEKLLGYHPGELIGAHYSTLVHPDDHAQAAQFFAKLGADEHPRQETELRLLHKDPG